MPTNTTTARKIEQAVERLVKEWDAVVVQQRVLDAEFRRITQALKALQMAYPYLTGKELSPPIPDFMTPNPTHGPEATIGDAMFDMLSRKAAPLALDEIVAELLHRRVRISEAAPKKVIRTAIRRDARKRFVRLADGRVWLAGKE